MNTTSSTEEQRLRGAVRVCEAAYGQDDPRLAVPLSALGAFCQARGRLTEAERIYRRVLTIVGTAGPP
jgi:hypothetical protein